MTGTLKMQIPYPPTKNSFRKLSSILQLLKMWKGQQLLQPISSEHMNNIPTVVVSWACMASWSLRASRKMKSS